MCDKGNVNEAYVSRLSWRTGCRGTDATVSWRTHLRRVCATMVNQVFVERVWAECCAKNTKRAGPNNADLGAVTCPTGVKDSPGGLRSDVDSRKRKKEKVSREQRRNADRMPVCNYLHADGPPVTSMWDRESSAH
jgi:hypothetical protein